MDRIGDAIQSLGYAGDLGPPKLAYVAMASRLLPQPMNLNFVAPSATGKSHAVDLPLELMPDGAVYFLRAASPRALIYTDEEFSNIESSSSLRRTLSPRRAPLRRPYGPWPQTTSSPTTLWRRTRAVGLRRGLSARMARPD